MGFARLAFRDVGQTQVGAYVSVGIGSHRKVVQGEGFSIPLIEGIFEPSNSFSW